MGMRQAKGVALPVAKSNALFTELYTTMDAADKVVEHLYMNINLSCSEVIGN